MYQLLIYIFDSYLYTNPQLSASFYRNADVVYVCFDLHDKSTFDTVPQYLRAAENFVKENTLFVLVGLKADLDHNVSKNEAQRFADEHALMYFEVSARFNSNVL